MGEGDGLIPMADYVRKRRPKVVHFLGCKAVPRDLINYTHISSIFSLRCFDDFKILKIFLKITTKKKNRWSFRFAFRLRSFFFFQVFKVRVIFLMQATGEANPFIPGLCFVTVSA